MKGRILTFAFWKEIKLIFRCLTRFWGSPPHASLVGIGCWIWVELCLSCLSHMFVFLVSSQRNRQGFPTPSSACFPHRLIVYKVIDTSLQNSAWQRNTYQPKWHFLILLQMKQFEYNHEGNLYLFAKLCITRQFISRFDSNGIYSSYRGHKNL